MLLNENCIGVSTCFPDCFSCFASRNYYTLLFRVALQNNTNKHIEIERNRLKHYLFMAETYNFLEFEFNRELKRRQV